MKSKAIIFGCGYWGQRAFSKLNTDFDVIAYADNNSGLWGGELLGKPVIPPDAIKDQGDALVFVCVKQGFSDIAKQLEGLGVSCMIWMEGLCYEYRDAVLYPVSFRQPEPYRKSGDEFSVLFVQDAPCVRTDKISYVLKQKGVMTQNAYFINSSNMPEAYCKENVFYSFDSLLEFVNESEFDIIHCSNEPDILVNVLMHSNKKIIHDCHDIVTMETRSSTMADAALEYIANTRADGVMYTTERMREVLMRMYGTDLKKTLVVGNYPLSPSGKVERLPKRSAVDGELHCVYEGLIIDRTEALNMPERFYEPLFLRLTELGIHVHIYSFCALDYLRQLDEDYPYIHYEGNYSGEQLISQMTQFDVGLLLWGENSAHVQLCSPNKMTEYLTAGLPVITNIDSFADVLAKNRCGGKVDLDLDRDGVAAQLEFYRKLPIADDFCDTHGFTMDANAERILNFYKKVICQ